MRIQLAGFFLVEFLELRWCEHIERAVASAVVVERLDVFEDRVGELDPRHPSPAVEQTMDVCGRARVGTFGT